jgi:sugar phosphate isomerase/epimerase
MAYTRRELGKIALGVLPAAGLLSRSRGLAAAADKPNSKVAGVQIGLNVPYDFGDLAMSGEEILQRVVQLGVSGVELRSQPVERYLGVRPDLIARGGGRGQRGADQEAARKTAAEELRKWRVAAPTDKVRAFRKMYEDAGVLIEIVKFDNIYNYADDELDYAFNLAKNLGARAISCEIDIPPNGTKRVGQFADKHGIRVGYHGHTKVTPAIWEEAFAYAKHNGANLDLGHFVAGNNTSPIPFLKQHHDRITHIHVKDRKLHEGPNVPFGQGDTPIKEALQLIRDNKWNIQATIEFEYPVPEGSDRMKEIAKCVEYCREALRA